MPGLPEMTRSPSASLNAARSASAQSGEFQESGGATQGDV